MTRAGTVIQAWTPSTGRMNRDRQPESSRNHLSPITLKHTSTVRNSAGSSKCPIAQPYPRHVMIIFLLNFSMPLAPTQPPSSAWNIAQNTSSGHTHSSFSMRVPLRTSGTGGTSFPSGVTDTASSILFLAFTTVSGTPPLLRGAGTCGGLLERCL